MNKIIATCIACIFPIAALAEPGELWEITSKTEMPGMPFAMPATTQQVCMPKGGATDPRQSVPDKDCKITDVNTSGNKTTWKMLCNRNGEVMNGTGEITNSASGYQGVSHLNGKSGGQAINMTSHYSGKRLGKSCDASQPAQQAAEAQKHAVPKRKDASAPSSNSLQPESGKPADSLSEGAKKLKGMFGF